MKDRLCHLTELSNRSDIPFRAPSCNPILIANFSHCKIGFLEMKSRVDFGRVHPELAMTFKMGVDRYEYYKGLSVSRKCQQRQQTIPRIPEAEPRRSQLQTPKASYQMDRGG